MKSSLVLIALVMVIGRTMLADPEAEMFVGQAIDDREIQRRLLEAGEELLRSGKAVPMSQLLRQMNRKECRLSLPEPSRRKISVETLVERCRPGVLVLGHLYKCDWCPRYHVRTETGFILTPSGAFATSYHVMKSKGDEALIAMTGDGRIAAVQEVLAADEATDVLILRLEGEGYTALPLQINARVGAKIWVLSHPDLDFYALSEGLISRYFIQREGTAETTMMAITADFAKGSSGAPVFDESGAVVAMVRNTRSVYYTVEEGRKDNLQMVFKHCVPAKYVRHLATSEAEPRRR